MSNSRVDRKYAIWLFPSLVESKIFGYLINTYSDRFGTSKFSPHATLCSGSYANGPNGVLKTMKQISSACSPIETSIDSIEQSEEKFTYFYLKLNTLPFRAISAKTKDSLPDSHLPQIGQHISLIYGTPNSAIKRSPLIFEMQSNLPSTIRFNKLALVTPKNNNWSDIENWKIQKIIPLK